MTSIISRATTAIRESLVQAQVGPPKRKYLGQRRLQADSLLVAYAFIYP